MLAEKAGLCASAIWNALNGTDGLTVKQLKKLTKVTEKEIYLGLGWLLREDKVVAEAIDEKEFLVRLK